MIETQGLTRRFGSLLAVDDLTLTIPDGEVFGLLGPNGAGKTTTMLMIAGLIGITSGAAFVDGRDVADPRQADIVRAALGILPEENGLYSDLSPRQTLDFFARLHHVRDRRARVDGLLERLSLMDRADAAVSTLSKGMKQRLALARALINEPRLVLLDEPTANLDPAASLEVRELLLELRGRGCTVVVNTHRLEEAERTCDRIGILHTRLLRLLSPTEPHAEVIRVGVEDSTDAVRAAAQALSDRPVEATGTGLLVHLRVGAAVPDLVAALVDAGGRITQVAPERPTLESVYLEAIADAR